MADDQISPIERENKEQGREKVKPARRSTQSLAMPQGVREEVQHKQREIEVK
jgi:hypothetical protein